MTDYGDGPERGNAQTWAFMAAECARLLRERDEARREVKRLRAEVERLREQVDLLCDASVERDAERELNADSRAEAIDDYREMKARAVSAERECIRLAAEVERLRAELTDA